MKDYRANFSGLSGLIDTHAHLSMLKPEGGSPEETLTQLFGAGFGGIIDIGTDAEDVLPRIERFGGFGGVRFAAGVWPYLHAIADPEGRFRALEAQVASAPAGFLGAVGECGLDRHHNTPESGADLAGEARLFELHIGLAKTLNLPLIVHSRDAAAETQEILGAYSGVRGVVHSFSYGIPEARQFLNLGYYLSFTGVLTYKNAHNLREAIRFAPADRVLLETDAPFLAPLPFRGRPAEPGMILETYTCAAGLLGMSLEGLKGVIARNCAELFGPGRRG